MNKTFPMLDAGTAAQEVAIVRALAESGDTKEHGLGYISPAKAELTKESHREDVRHQGGRARRGNVQQRFPAQAVGRGRHLLARAQMGGDAVTLCACFRHGAPAPCGLAGRNLDLGYSQLAAAFAAAHRGCHVGMAIRPDLDDIAVTLIETLIGFAVAMLVAIPIAALLVSSNLLWRAFYPVLAGVQSVPKNAIAPLLILWFGTGQLSKAIIAFLISFFPIVINAVSGMTLVDADAHDMMKTLRASRWQVFWYFRLPNALPFIFAAAKVSITLALVGAVIGEFVGADSGLGYVILISSSQLHTDVAFVAIVLLAAIGMALFSLVGLVERLAMPWLTPEPQQHVLV